MLCFCSRLNSSPLSRIRPIVVYLIERHPLDLPETGPLFEWLRLQEDFLDELEELIGTFDQDDLSILVDKHPGGPSWRDLLQALLDEEVQMVVTHLAPLSSAQRQQLIGICDQMGAQLITPADAGRNTLTLNR